MTQKQATSLKKLLPTPVIIGSNVRLDDMMRQVGAQSNYHVDCMTIQRLDTLLSEGMSVIMWGGYLGEELYPVQISYHRRGSYHTNDFEYGSCLSNLDALYHLCFDLLDRHEQETGDGVIVDTLVAPHLVLVIPGSN